MKRILMPLLLALLISCKGKEAYVQLSEAELKAMLLNDTVYLAYNEALIEFSQGIAYNKWNLKQHRKVDKEEIKKLKSMDEMLALYKKAGYDEGFTNAFNKMYFQKAKVKEKYKSVIQHQPKLFEKVAAENIPSLNLDVEKVKSIYSKGNYE